MENEELQRVAQFLFEVGTMRKISRMHRQLLLTDDMSDNIATHSFRVAVIGYFLAKMEEVDPLKVVMMCILHDMGESRTNDHNWVHKKYVSEAEGQILEDQFGSLPFNDFHEIGEEYSERQSRESIVAKDADVLDQILLLREYEWQGNREATKWLGGKRTEREYAYLDYVKTESGRTLGMALYNEDPSSWWKNLYTNLRRKEAPASS